MGKQLALGEPPTLVEYMVNGVRWRCNHFDQLAAEIGLTETAQLALFQEQVSANERSWMLVRRLFGMMPMLPPASYSLDDCREWTRKELYAALGITRAQLQQELEAVRGAWSKIAPKAAAPMREEPKAEPKEEFHFGEEALLAKYGFRISGVGRELASWFAQRVKDYERLLNEKVTSELARNALITELQMRQFDEVMMDAENNRVGGETWRKNVKMRQELEGTYREQINQILEKAPWASSIAGKYSFGGQLSDVTKGIQDYQGRGDTRLIDGMFTALELRVECRRSVQTPAPRYRAGLVASVAAARAGLWEPNWESPFERAELKRLDLAWKEAYAAACQEAGEPLPDLEKDGPGSEYAELRKEEA